MTRHSLRAYIAVWALLALVITGLATHRAGLWGRSPAPTTSVAALAKAERAHRQEVAQVQAQVSRRWAAYRRAREQRLDRIAAMRRTHAARLEARRRAIAARQRQIARLRRA